MIRLVCIILVHRLLGYRAKSFPDGVYNRDEQILTFKLLQQHWVSIHPTLSQGIRTDSLISKRTTKGYHCCMAEQMSVSPVEWKIVFTIIFMHPGLKPEETAFCPAVKHRHHPVPLHGDKRNSIMFLLKRATRDELLPLLPKQQIPRLYYGNVEVVHPTIHRNTYNSCLRHPATAGQCCFPSSDLPVSGIKGPWVCLLTAALIRNISFFDLSGKCIQYLPSCRLSNHIAIPQLTARQGISLWKAPLHDLYFTILRHHP